MTRSLQNNLITAALTRLALALPAQRDAPFETLKDMETLSHPISSPSESALLLLLLLLLVAFVVGAME